MIAAQSTRILILGAGGLIGHHIAADLAVRGFQLVAVARRFTPAQRNCLGSAAREVPAASLDAAAIAALAQDCAVVVNCLGLLQDTPWESTRDVHESFGGKLLDALRMLPRPPLLIHVSMPGTDADDRTSFSRTKRNADRAICGAGLPHVILRPGFVVAPRAYGGSAMLRAAAALPFDLPASFGKSPLATIAVEDIAETVAVLAQRWRENGSPNAAILDLMHPRQRTLAEVVGSFRSWLGTTHRTIRLPLFMLRLGAWAGDISAWLGWRPPLRSTALAELQRGVAGDPRAWMEMTGIVPRSLDDVLRARPATVQEKWFARLFLLKPLIVAILGLFWIASASIALTAAYPAAVAILTSHGCAQGAARAITAASSLVDLFVGLGIIFRRTNVYALIAGIAVSLFYMIAAAVLTPDLWIEPLGALVKTFPAIVLMLVALAIADDR